MALRSAKTDMISAQTRKQTPDEGQKAPNRCLRLLSGLSADHVRFGLDQRSSGRTFKQVKTSGVHTDLSHDLYACGNVLMHIDIIRGMYTSLGSGDILVRMYGSWEKIMVDQRRSRLFFKQVKHSRSISIGDHSKVPV